MEIFYSVIASLLAAMGVLVAVIKWLLIPKMNKSNNKNPTEILVGQQEIISLLKSQDALMTSRHTELTGQFRLINEHEARVVNLLTRIHERIGGGE